ncbi:hypothetical protein DID88_007601 [Monilinia fructigena]|uniref:Uncharacterized protein n=1 Tax=Monilinia fructigena TaxID=38457 RepID=A0A395J3W3_9HELO|nr:hypothetical protein DID88_007601 [Monilinia fructigena]
MERLGDKRQPLGIRDQNELPGDYNYVRNWLAQTQNEDVVDSFGQSRPRIGHLEGLVRHSHYPHTTYRPIENRNAVTSKPKPDQECTFSDSSLIKVSTAPVRKERTKIPEISHATEYGDIKRSHKYRKNVPSTTTSGSSQSSVVQPKQETFEKRHATRPERDRYDTKKGISKVEVTKKPIKKGGAKREGIERRLQEEGERAHQTDQVSSKMAELLLRLDDEVPQIPSEEVGNLKTHPETTNSVVTWSESQHSPRATTALDRAREEYLQRQHSATPDSVRKSIERTGIFKDTGIEYSSRRKSYLQEAAGKEVNGVRKKSMISLPRIPPLKSRPPDSVDVEDKEHRRVVVEYYDPNRGWYRKENSKSPTHPLDPVAAPIPVPFTRQQMARNARIKRPSTTLPVIREASDESLENSPSSISGISGEEIQRTESAPIRWSIVEGDISGYISNLHTNADEAQDRLILEPQVPGLIASQIDSWPQHNQQSRPDQQIGSMSSISRDAIPQSVMTDQREGQTRTGYINGTTRTPSKPTLHIRPNRENLPFLTRPLFRRGPQTSHEPPRQYIASIPRSPLIRLPSLYVQQLEYEQNEMSNGVFNENVEECGALKAQEPHFNTNTYDENWDNAQTADEIPYEAEDVLGYDDYIGDLSVSSDLKRQNNTDIFEGSTSRPEVTEFGYEKCGSRFSKQWLPNS